MKSFSAFITEKKKPEKPEGVNQADVSKEAAKYRRAQRQRGATGGPTTGRTGSKSFPGDRSGAYARAKSDMEARQGLKAAGASGDVSDTAPKPVRDKVTSARQARAAAAGTPDPFDPKSPKAPARPFKSLTKLKAAAQAKRGAPAIPDPFEGSTTKPVRSKPKEPSGPGPATKQAIADINKAQANVEKSKIRNYVTTQTKSGSYVSPELKDAIAGGRTRGSEVRVGGPTAPARTPRSKSVPKSSVARARAAGDFRRAVNKIKYDPISSKKGSMVDDLLKAPESVRRKSGISARTSTFADFSKQATELQQRLNPGKYTSPAGTLDPTRGRGSGGSVNPSTNRPNFKNTTRSGYKPEYKPKSGSEIVSGGNPKVTVNTTGSTGSKQGLNTPLKSFTEFDRQASDAARKAAMSGKDAQGNILSKAERKRLFNVSRNPQTPVVYEPPSTSKSSTGTGGSSLSTKGGPLATTSRSPRKPPQRGLPAAKKALAQSAASSAQAKTVSTIKQTLGKTASRGLGAVGSGLDAYLNYRDYREKGDSKLRAGLKSAFRTGLGWIGGAAGSALGSAGGPVGTVGGGIAGYSAGTWLADKVLGRLRQPTKKK